MDVGSWLRRLREWATRSPLTWIDEFIDQVGEYLKVESQPAAWRQFADEIDSLTIQDVNYWWPKKPRAGMVFFNGPDEFRLWHRDIDANRLFGLAFDS